ncbi:MAG: RagB/SusD family nutrient uptake outer membrane protein [Prevotella sp.]|nr:RagB/SusD family nutrient uptake outer membrane protein [Prevotella sp.]
MKTKGIKALANKITVIGCCLLVIGLNACTDDIKFGSSFLEKAPSSDVTEDTVFNNAEYTRQFVTAIYAKQYYGLPYLYNELLPNHTSPWVGKFDALTDCWQLHYNGTQVYKVYYSGTLNSSNNTLFMYNGEQMWEAVRAGYKFLEHIADVPGMTQSEKSRLIAETKCLIASQYFQMFQHYGGLPLITKTYSGTESTYQAPRATVEETVNYIVQLLDDAINTPDTDFPWALYGDDFTNNAGRWTKAGAMALKVKTLLLAASPLYNADKPYFGGSSAAEQQHLVWYGNYDATRWTKVKDACEAFFNKLNANPGSYELSQAVSDGWSTPSVNDYRLAYRKGYFLRDSREIIHSVRVNGYDNLSGGRYNWHSWINNGRNSYCPTQEYVEMFSWSDGTPFNWDESAALAYDKHPTGKSSVWCLEQMFKKGEAHASIQQELTNVRLTRDPRLYEEVICNGIKKNLDWTSANMSGDIWETYVGGTDAKQSAVNETGMYATGYMFEKYYLGNGSGGGNSLRRGTQWVSLGLPEMYLYYAEALMQTGDLTKALDQIEVIRKRVGLTKKLSTIYPEIKSDKDVLLRELLRERACELGLSDARWFDMIRYKRTDWMTKELHGLLVYRLKEDQSGQLVRSTDPWVDGDKKTDNQSTEPNRFEFEKFTLRNIRRAQWDKQPDDPDVLKFLMSPFPLKEVNLGYGLIQNPGW